LQGLSGSEQVSSGLAALPPGLILRMENNCVIIVVKRRLDTFDCAFLGKAMTSRG
jgi:hypothetical protein